MERIDPIERRGDRLIDHTLVLEHAMELCAEMNERTLAKQMGWWFFVSPRNPETGKGYTVERLDGAQAEAARADANGKAKWEPEEGEMAWVGRAVAVYRERYPDRNPLKSKADKAHFQNMMDSWHKAAPWRKQMIGD